MFPLPTSFLHVTLSKWLHCISPMYSTVDDVPYLDYIIFFLLLDFELERERGGGVGERESQN